mgnify:CR=1 FL=1
MAFTSASKKVSILLGPEFSVVDECCGSIFSLVFLNVETTCWARAAPGISWFITVCNLALTSCLAIRVKPEAKLLQTSSSTLFLISANSTVEKEIQTNMKLNVVQVSVS